MSGAARYPDVVLFPSGGTLFIFFPRWAPVARRGLVVVCHNGVYSLEVGTLADARCVLLDVTRHAKERSNVCFCVSFATRRQLAAIINHLVRLPAAVSFDDPIPLLLTGLAHLRTKAAYVHLQHAWTAINIAQAVALHVLWLARTDVHLGHTPAPMNGERARVLFVVQLRCQLRRIGQHLPALMDLWTQPPRLFSDNRRVLYFE